MQQNFLRAVGAGIVGTVVMSLLSYLGSLMVPAMMPPWAMLAMQMGGLVGGWIGHIMIGLILALIYAYGFAGILPGNSWSKGAIYGVLPWLAAMVVVIPMMGMPLFAGSFLVALGSLMGHIAYGAFVGGVYGKLAAVPEQVRAERAR